MHSQDPFGQKGTTKLGHVSQIPPMECKAGLGLGDLMIQEGQDGMGSHCRHALSLLIQSSHSGEDLHIAHLSLSAIPTMLSTVLGVYSRTSSRPKMLLVNQLDYV